MKNKPAKTGTYKNITSYIYNRFFCLKLSKGKQMMYLPQTNAI